MVTPIPATPNPDPNPNPKTAKKKNVYHIGGLPVEFPYKPYGTQLAFMGRVISTLDRSQREGRCHALLESPTGTGKSLSLLCSTLAWQQSYKSKNSMPYSQPKPDPLAHDNDQPSSTTVNNNKNRRINAPTIFYTSRTHSQITQVIREYRKTGYRVPMAVLAARKHYCTNPNLRGKSNLDEECKLLLRKGGGQGCPEYVNVGSVKAHPSLQKGGCHEPHDIEDLVKVGQAVKGCSYYAARELAGEAELVFCPYNYIINPVIRGAMEVNIVGAVIVLDEAHNMEDIARDAGSVDIDEEALHKLKADLEDLCQVKPSVYEPLYKMTQGLLSWIDCRKKTLEKREFQHYVSYWTGDKALSELQESNISQESFPSLLRSATKAIKNASDTKKEVEHLSSMSVITLEGLFSSLTYFFSRSGSHMSDFQLALQKYVKRDATGKAFSEWTHTLSLWCLNPAVVFRDVAALSLSVILTSGTLSPMNSFSSELGLQFGTCLEAPHVVDTESQVWSAIISTGPTNFPLNASYKIADEYAFQDALGKSLENILKIVPGGCLVFFPSYKLLEKLRKRWCETGQWPLLNAIKTLFLEPRGGSQEDFESFLKGYNDAIRGASKPLSSRKKRTIKLEFNNHFTAIEHMHSTNVEGAALFAVCRGKVSEGIDFSDDNARAVIIVGIPFPNLNDIQVELKMSYNDVHKSSKNLLSGSEWYCHQAFRALNQAAGRCIRHRFDYGAIIFLDARYQRERNTACVSKWLRKSIRQYDNFDSSLEGLKLFFSYVKERMSKNTVNVMENSDTNLENIPSTRKQDQKSKKPDLCGREDIYLTKYNTSLPPPKSQDDIELEASAQMDEGADNCHEVIDPCSPQRDTRYPTTLSHEDPEVSIVKETPYSSSNTTGSPCSFSKDETSASTINPASIGIQDQFSFDPSALTNPNKNSLKAQCSRVVTPQKNLAMDASSSILEMESSDSPLSFSVNSCSSKRRKSICSSPLVCLIEEEHDIVDSSVSDCTTYIRNSTANGDVNPIIDFGVGTKCAKEKSESSVPQLLTINNYSMTSGPVMDKRLRIYCSFCKNALGLPANHQYVICYLTNSSKIHLESLHRKKVKPQTESKLEGIPVLVTDISSVHQLLCSRTLEGGSGQGIWSEKDGCVFSTIFCPFCSSDNNCLGVEVMATNASNIHLLNKIMLYVEQLEINNFKACIYKDSKDEKPSPVNASSMAMDEVASLNYLDSSDIPQKNNSGGWRTTKPNVRS